MAGIGVTRVTDCPVCLGTFKDPRVLPCGHTFCLGCIAEHGRSKGSDPDCPNCRTKFQIPSNGFDALPKNYSLNSVLGENSSIERTSRAKITEGSTCKKHNGEELVLYCVQCSVVICLDCIEEEHQKHHCYKISRYAKEVRTQLDGYLKSITPILSEVRSQKTQLQEKSTKFLSLLAATESAINEECEKNKQLLDDHRRLLLEELSNEKHKVTKGLKMKTDELETEELGLASFNTRIEEILQGTDEAKAFDMVVQFKDLKDSFDKLKQTQPQTMGQVSMAGIEFIPSDFRALISRRGNAIGRLQKESHSGPSFKRSRVLRKDITPSREQVDLSQAERVPIEQDVWYYLERKHPNKVNDIAAGHLCISRVVCVSSNEGITHCLEIVPYYQSDSEEAKKSVEDAVQQFAQLYQKVSEPGIVRVVIDLPLAFNKGMLQQMISELEEVGVFFLRGDNPCLVGTKGCIEEAKRRLSDFTRRQKNSPAQTQPNDDFGLASAADPIGPMKFKTPQGLKVHVAKGNLVSQSVDAIVNSSNENLGNGGGASRTIADAAGYQLERECKEFIQQHGKLELARVMHTSAGNLRPKILFVIHTVGPRKSDARDEELFCYVRLAILNCLCYANDELRIHSIAIPAISSGIFGVSIEIVGRASFEALKMFDFYYASSKKKSLREIYFLNNDQPTVDNMKRIFQTMMTDTKESSIDPEQPAINVEKASGLAKKKTAKSDDDKKADDDNHCIICMDYITDKKELSCKHKFCRDCIDEYFSKGQPKCPTCGKVFGTLKGYQPKGTMTSTENSWQHLAGYHNCGTIEIEYYFPDGKQGENHPNPGQSYRGTHRTAYLPANKEGKEVLCLLKRAFDADLVFTIGRNPTTGRENCVIWNDVHHKTSTNGQYGYPDPTYLKRVKEELAAKGIQ